MIPRTAPSAPTLRLVALQLSAREWLVIDVNTPSIDPRSRRGFVERVDDAYEATVLAEPGLRERTAHLSDAIDWIEHASRDLEHRD
jgi:hypothetical protein